MHECSGAISGCNCCSAEGGAGWGGRGLSSRRLLAIAGPSGDAATLRCNVAAPSPDPWQSLAVLGSVVGAGPDGLAQAVLARGGPIAAVATLIRLPPLDAADSNWGEESRTGVGREPPR